MAILLKDLFLIVRMYAYVFVCLRTECSAQSV